jgi:hypothetical protein
LPPPKPRRTGVRAALVVFIVLLIVGPTVVGSIVRLVDGPTPTPTPVPAPTTHTPVPRPTNTTGEVSGPRFDQWPIDPDPPPLPNPQVVADLDLYLNANPLYDQSVVPVPCTVGDVDLVNSPIRVIEDYMTDIVACLMDAWDDPVYDAGFQLPRPSITVYDQEIMTKCGASVPGNAFYCPLDQQMYYSYDLIMVFPDSLRTARYVAEAIIAHEFGHVVQARTGIEGSQDYMYGTAATEEEANEWSRRLELQADCFAGEFLQSIAAASGLTPDDRANAQLTFRLIGDTEGGDHGLPVNRVSWFDRGFDSPSVRSCDTFTAPGNQVT